MVNRNKAKKQARNRDRLEAPNLNPLSPYSAVPVERQIYDSLRASLMRGEMAPASKISSRSIAESMGVSSMPVRQALKMLEADNILESQAKKGFVVKSLSDQEFEEILLIRLKLEGLLVREATNKLTASKINSLGRLERKMLRETDVRRTLDLNYQFHFAIYRAANMPISLAIVENIWLRIGPALWGMVDDYPSAEADKNHGLMVSRLEAGDSEGAEAALQQDLLDGASAMGYSASAEGALRRTASLQVLSS